MQTFRLQHCRPGYGKVKPEAVGSWEVVAESWAKAVAEAHQGVPYVEDGDYFVWLS